MTTMPGGPRSAPNGEMPGRGLLSVGSVRVVDIGMRFPIGNKSVGVGTHHCQGASLLNNADQVPPGLHFPPCHTCVSPVDRMPYQQIANCDTSSVAKMRRMF